MPEQDPFANLTRKQYEQMIDGATAQLTDEDWQGIHQMLAIEWERNGSQAWVVDRLLKADPKTSPPVRRLAFDLATGSEVGRCNARESNQ